MPDDLKKKTATALAWSLLQSWSVKFLSLLLFFVLARYLAPEQMGLVQSVTVLLAFVAVVSEQGFHSALIQRQGLRKVDVNLPFILVTGVASAGSLVMYFYAAELAVLLKEPAAEKLLQVAAVVPPITAANGIAMAMLRRELNFKAIARAAFAASLISGMVALYLVTQGWGPMALVIQAALASLVTAMLIWPKANWRPRLAIDTQNFKGLFKFSSASFTSQLIDFFSGRLIDLIILSRFGLASLGVYAVGAKLYLTLLELLATALMVVAMSSMAKLLSDRERLKRTYLRFIFLASCSTMPLFVGIASLAPEICLILFGSKWNGAVEITRWLCLLGAVQVVQFFNGAALDATGNPRSTLLINLTKLGVGLVALTLYPADTIAQLTVAFVVAQLCVTPLSFGLSMRVTKVRFINVIVQVIPGSVSSLAAYFAVSALRTVQIDWISSVWISLLVYGVVFSVAFGVMLVILGGGKVVSEMKFVLASYKK